MTDTARYADLVLPATTQLEQHDIMFSWGHFYGGTVDPLPYYVPPRETADAGFRLNLISPKSHAYLNSSAGDQPAQRRVQGEQAVTVHPRDAAERGITDGQYVRVYNDRGQFIALAPPFVFADLGNAPTFSDTRVEIEPAQAGDS